jgi:hypothetical protein
MAQRNRLAKRYSRTRVCGVEEGMQVRFNGACIIPPDRDLPLPNGAPQLLERTAVRDCRRISQPKPVRSARPDKFEPGGAA